MTRDEAVVEELNYFEGGRGFRVFVLRQAYNTTLPNFVGYDPNERTLLVSETTPRMFLDYILGHEVLCRVDHVGQKGCCLRATKDEFARVPDHIKPEYASFRLEFYRHLISFYSCKETERDFMDEISASLAFWEEAVAAT